jgi:hypothetical protein
MYSPEKTMQGNSAVTLEQTKSIVDQMFPGSTYSIQNGMIDFSEPIAANYQTLYLEQIRFGRFVENKNEYVAILRAPENVTVHAGGFYYTICAVFDAETNKIKSQNKDFTADEGEISILKGRNRDFVLLLGSTTYQGYTTPLGGIYDASKGYWEQTWPDDNDFWNERYAVFGNNRLILYKKIFEQVNYETSGPLYHFEPEKELIWDSREETFREPLR